MLRFDLRPRVSPVGHAHWHSFVKGRDVSTEVWPGGKRPPGPIVKARHDYSGRGNLRRTIKSLR